MLRFLSAILLFLILSAGCSNGSKLTRGSMPDIQNVILIGIDTLRAKQLGFMGYDRQTSPFLDEFSKKCIVFDRAYTPKSLTLSAFTTLLSGRHVLSHRVNGNGLKIPKELHLLTEDFSSAGFRCLGFSAAEVISKKYGIAKGFNYYTGLRNTPGAQIPGSTVNDTLSRFFAGNPRKGELSFLENDDPLFLFLHYFDTHTPYTPGRDILKRFGDPEYNGQFDGSHKVVRKYNMHPRQFDKADLRHCMDLYDAEISILDKHLEHMITMLETAGLMENSIIVIVADHGENLGEHTSITHGQPYEDGLHVPLMFHFPGDWGAGKRIDSLVELTDVLPTAMEIASVPVPDGLDGRSLIPLMLEEEVPYRERNYLLSLGGANEEKKTTFGITDGTYRLIKDIHWSEESLLYNIIDDPHETEDIAEENPEIVELLESIIAIMADRLVPEGSDATSSLDLDNVEMDAETEEMLRSLGYMQ